MCLPSFWYGNKFSSMQFQAPDIYCPTSFSTNKCITEFHLFIHVDLAHIVTLYITYMIWLSLPTANLSYFGYHNVYIYLSVILSVLWGISYVHPAVASSQNLRNATTAPAKVATTAAMGLKKSLDLSKFLAPTPSMDAPWRQATTKGKIMRQHAHMHHASVLTPAVSSPDQLKCSKNISLTSTSGVPPSSGMAGAFTPTSRKGSMSSLAKMTSCSCSTLY